MIFVCDGCIYRRISIIRTLLILSGIEINPGPIKLITVNCRGLSSRVKLLSTIGKLRKESEKDESCIIFMQETHLDDAELITKIWDGTQVVSSYFNNSQRGTIIILKGNISVSKSITDQDGRFNLIHVSHDLFQEGDDNCSLTLVNIYAPNNHKDSLAFFGRIFSRIEELNRDIINVTGITPDTIIAGDFNFVFDDLVDCQNRKVSNDEKILAQSVSDKLYELELWDLVQSSTEDINFTWRRESVRSRLDYIFATSRIASRVKSFKNKWQLVKTDHAAVVVELAHSVEMPSGRSYPKLSFADIKDINDKMTVRESIISAKRDFMKEWCPHTRLEYVKLMIRSSVLKIRSRKNRENSQLDILKHERNMLEKLNVLDDDAIKRLTTLSSDIDRIEEEVEEQMRIKSGLKWREEGERSTKFFLNLINSKIRMGAAHKGFVDAHGRVLRDKRDITNHARNFYSNLYSNMDTAIDQQFYSNCPKLESHDSEMVGAPILISELKATLKTCKDSTPGLDGIPYSFYKIFHDLLLPLVLDSWNYGVKTGKLAPSHRQSCITIIPKAGKDTRLIKNWRPITVASCDLKVITKTLSDRMAKVAPSIIFNSQMAYVPGRDINFNNRILSYINDNVNNNEDVIVSFDAEKAFDSVSHAYLKETLRRYGFPDNFIKYFSTIYNDNSAVVQVNGHLTDPFAVSRGVKQGDALSCLLFVLAVDPLIRNIEANNDISPITIKEGNNNIDVKTLAYADDIAVLTKRGMINTVFEEYERLFNNSGLKLNADKTEILHLDKSNALEINVDVSYLNNSVALMSTNKIKICGNYLLHDASERYKLNVIEKIELLKKVLGNWSRRNLTPNGKMMIIKCHALSQLTFVNQFTNISALHVKQIEALCYKFVWNGGTERVKRSTLKLDKLEGGINGVDIDSFLSAAKIRQFFKADKYSSSLQFIQQYCSNKDCITIAVKNCISKLMRSNWKTADILDLSTEDKRNLVNCDLRYFFKSGSKTDELLKSLDLEISSLNEIIKYGRNIVNKVVKMLPNIFRGLMGSTFPSVAVGPSLIIQSKLKLISGLSSRLLQKTIKEQFNKCIKFTVNSKHDQVSSGDHEDKQCFFNLWKIRNPVLRNCRLKVLYKDIFCHERRHRFGISDSPFCKICKNTETVQHQLYECNNAKRMWMVFENIFSVQINYKSIIIVGPDKCQELVKSLLIKLLIQIDRSEFVSISQIYKRIHQVLALERSVDKNNKIYDVILYKLESLMKM